jgi:imidazolonepropionase-like amidohydrolase
MSIKTLTSLAAGVLAATVSTAGAQTDPVVVRASSAFDGRGRSVSDATVLVQGGKIVSVESGRSRPATYDLRGLTLLPGLIDTHVHLDTHFGKDGRATSQGEAPPQSMLYEAENAYVTLMAGFTTVQSIGSPLDVDMRAAIARGIMPGPRLLTSIRPVNENTGTPEQIRAFIRKVKADGADLVKLFASKSSREGGGQTMTDEQIQAACGEAKAAGLRSWVHAHSPSSVRAATLAGCTTVTHGSQVTDAELKLMQQHGTYFEPNIGLVSQNYLENKSRYFGIGNFNEEGFAFTEKGIPMKREMFKKALAVAGLKLLMGTDAGAGAHGRSAEEIIYRVQIAGQPARDALAGTTSLNAQSLGLADRVGALAAGLDADLIGVDGNPLEDITSLRRVVFVMKGGVVYKNVARSAHK